MEDAYDVLAAFRLGWSVAEMRGRNRPDGPPAEADGPPAEAAGPPAEAAGPAGLPDHVDHPLPLRIERGKTELRIEIQSVVAELAEYLCVDAAPDGTRYSDALGDKAKLLAHARAPKAADALRQALDLLGQQHNEQAKAALHAGLALQRAVVARRQQALAVVQFSRAPEAAVRAEQAGCACEEAGLAALEHVIEVFASDAQAVIVQHQDELAAAAHQPWEDLAELLWQFDAHVQDRLAALSESQAIGYQLGRGLAETYWALNPGQQDGSASWGFLLGQRRCEELERLTGRLAVYMGEYTAPAIAGSLEVWRAVVSTPRWMGDPARASQALYSQIRRWYELIVLGQDPTTLIGPAAVMRNYRTLTRAFQLFWPELAATAFGVAALITLLFLVNVGGAAAWLKTLSGVLAAVGLSLAGLTGTLKNSAQALTKRLRQDAYTDLVALAVQTAPAPPDKAMLQQAINRRALTPATPN